MGHYSICTCTIFFFSARRLGWCSHATPLPFISSTAPNTQRFRGRNLLLLGRQPPHSVKSQTEATLSISSLSQHPHNIHQTQSLLGSKFTINITHTLTRREIDHSSTTLESTLALSLSLCVCVSTWSTLSRHELNRQYGYCYFQQGKHPPPLPRCYS